MEKPGTQPKNLGIAIIGAGSIVSRCARLAAGHSADADKWSKLAREIEARRRKLMQIQKQISKRGKKQWVGREVDVLLEGASAETDLLLEGRAAMHAPEIDAKVLINDVPDGMDVQPGKFYRCEITEAHDYDVVARLI